MVGGAGANWHTCCVACYIIGFVLVRLDSVRLLDTRFGHMHAFLGSVKTCRNLCFSFFWARFGGSVVAVGGLWT